VALVLNLLDAIPYGLAILPAQFSAFAPLGVTVLHTCSGCDLSGHVPSVGRCACSPRRVRSW